MAFNRYSPIHHRAVCKLPYIRGRPAYYKHFPSTHLVPIHATASVDHLYLNGWGFDSWLDKIQAYVDSHFNFLGTLPER